MLLAAPFVPAFVPAGITLPSACFRHRVRWDHSSLGPEFRTGDRPPKVSSNAFSAQPPDLQPAPLMDLDFVVIGRLVRRLMPSIRFLSIGSHLCSTLPPDPLHEEFTYIKVSKRLSPPSCRTCSAHEKKGEWLPTPPGAAPSVGGSSLSPRPPCNSRPKALPRRTRRAGLPGRCRFHRHRHRHL